MRLCSNIDSLWRSPRHPDRLGRSLSILMLAGVAAAYIGPKMATELQSAIAAHLYAGSFLGLECADDMCHGRANHVRSNHPKVGSTGGVGTIASDYRKAT